MTSASSIYYQSDSAADLSISLTRNSSINSQNNTSYSFRIGVPFEVSGTIIIQMPNEFECELCMK